MPPDPTPRWPQRLFVLLQYPLPHHGLSRLVHLLAESEWRPFKNLLIRAFIRAFRIDMDEPIERDPAGYRSFNAFFTRALRPGVRPLAVAPEALLCPVDGQLSERGAIQRGRIYQAKGQDFGLTELLGGDTALAAQLDGGVFATIYLSPRDYHRVHMPLAGRLRTMRYVPGRLFSVNPITTRLVPRLFARNERLVCVFETAAGPMALILVGAIFVGSIETAWAGRLRAAPGRAIQRWDDGELPGAAGTGVHLERGAEMGRFNMGSTLILLLPPGRVDWAAGLAPGMRLRMGQAIGRLTGAADATPTAEAAAPGTPA